MKKFMSPQKQSNINKHGENKFSELVQYGLTNGGIHTVASKNHGKSRLMFSMAKTLRALDNVKVYIFDGSETWLYAFDRIPTFTIAERDIVLSNEVNTTEDIERYELSNWNLIRLALSTEKVILFRLKSRKPSKRGFAVRTIINYLDSQQRAQRARTPNNEATQFIAYFIEEAQDTFNSRSTTRLEAEEFLTVFNEARNQKQSFFTASQRLNDFSKTIRTKQLYCIGKISAEDKTVFLRRLENKYNINFSELPQRHWFFEGSTFISPIWKQHKKPYQINKEIKQKFLAFVKPKLTEKKLSLLEKLSVFLFGIQPQQPKNAKVVIGSGIEALNNENEDTEEENQFDEDLLLFQEEFSDKGDC